MLSDKKRRIKNTVAITMAMVMILLGVVASDGSNVLSSYGADENVVDNPNYADNQLIVVFNEDVDRASAADIVAFALSEEMINERRSTSGIKSIRDSINIKKIKTDNNMMLISLSTSVDEKAAAREIAKNPDVDSAQPNYIYSLNDGEIAEQMHDNGDWYLDFIGAEKAQKLVSEARKTTDKVIVACLDTGVIDDHEALSGVETITTSTDEIVYGHGTQMAGLIAKTAGKDNVKILDIDTFKENVYGSGTVTTTADVIAGIDYACRHDARIITMAFGRHGYDNALVAKMDWAAKEDVLLIASAGDNGNDESWYPADYENCLGCINTVKFDKTEDDTFKNSSSNYGDAKNISAPGTQISVADINGGFVQESGSAYSAAVIAGTAAMVIFANPDLTAAEVSEILISTADDLGEKDFDTFTANGNVNANKAVTKALKQGK